MSDSQQNPQEQPVPPKPEEDEEPISLVDVEEVAGERSSSVRAIGAAAAGARPARKTYQRALNLTGQGATRCRVFHSKISVAALHIMEEQINDWLDGEQIEVKQVGHLVGTLTGKTAEENVIVLVWY